MRRKITIAVLALGTFLGYGSGIAQLNAHRSCQSAHRAAEGDCGGWHHD